VCVCVYVCVFVCVCVCVVCLSLYASVSECECVCIPIHIHVYIQIYIITYFTLLLCITLCRILLDHTDAQFVVLFARGDIFKGMHPPPPALHIHEDNVIHQVPSCAVALFKRADLVITGRYHGAVIRHVSSSSYDMHVSSSSYDMHVSSSSNYIHVSLLLIRHACILRLI